MNIPPPPAAAEEAFERLGRITRQLHEAMTELGLEQGLLAVARRFQMPGTASVMLGK